MSVDAVPGGRPAGFHPAALQLVVAAVLVALCLAVYSPVADQSFVSFDDPMYVTGNPAVLRGLSASGVKWAFTTTHASNWHPLTWLSHMLDATLFGPVAARHKQVNVALHTVNSLLVFLLLGGATGKHLRAALVAALFAVHPLNVESVAWVAERKNLLCSFFWLLTAWAYAGYARRPGAGRYLAVVCLFCAALLSKPMAVTLPFALLLLDAWPLGRPRDGNGARGDAPGRRAADRWLFLVREKIPLFLLSAAASATTYLVQDRGYAVSAMREPAWSQRISNALVSYAGYLGKAVWPASLAVHYPFPEGALPAAAVVGAGALLTLLTIAVLVRSRSHPWLCPGWLWFLGTMVPVIGIVQVGDQAMADRYMYIPLLGVIVPLVWELAERVPAKRSAGLAAAAVAAACLVVLASVSRNQLGYWKTSVDLFRRAAEVSPDSAVVRNNYGASLLDIRAVAPAEEHLRVAVRIRENYPEAHHNLAECLRMQGRFAEAAFHYREALRVGGRDPAVRHASEAALRSLGVMPPEAGRR